MPRPGKRTRSRKRTCTSLPGGRNAVHYKQEINASRHCSICGKPLGGIRQVSPIGVNRLNRSKRRIWRPYGGQICHNCLKDSLKQALRSV